MAHIRFKSIIVAAVLTGCMAAGAIRAAQEDVKVNHTSLKTGDMAPDFTLLDNHWKQIHLSDYRGKKNVVLAFYVLAFTEG
jgi:cytochrome oxidase Cu insertion factor (SCO1/SenC/PrrC family)